MSSHQIFPRRPTDTALYVGRTILFVQTLATSAAYGMGAAPVLSLLGQGRIVNSHVTSFFKVLGGIAMGIQADVEGKEHLSQSSPAVFVCNHQSVLDLYVICQVFPKNCVVMAKDELFWVPFLGQFLYMANNIFINRENSKSAKATMQFVASEMSKKNLSLLIFPEGTRSHQTTNDFLPFKKGAFHLAIEGQYPIVPIVISTYGDLYNSRQMLFRGGKLRARVLPPISTKGMGLQDMDKLCSDTRNTMLQVLREISPPVKQEWVIPSKL
ncbi:hypothetical protein DFJ73DRAFT_863967 [Zopfochytrium polystomum]|nr:hypothetical protein DFJ73DRAFT_863967 [Zopfochytrium polystomum]